MSTHRVTWLAAFFSPLLAPVLLAPVALVLAVVFAWAFRAGVGAHAAPRVITGVGDIVILRHTYDGPELIDGRLLDWQYGYDGMQIEMSDAGDGIFRHDFEEPSCRP